MVSACRASAERLRRPVDVGQIHWSASNYAPWQEVPLSTPCPFAYAPSSFNLSPATTLQALLYLRLPRDRPSLIVLSLERPPFPNLPSELLFFTSPPPLLSQPFADVFSRVSSQSLSQSNSGTIFVLRRKSRRKRSVAWKKRIVWITESFQSAKPCRMGSVPRKKEGLAETPVSCGCFCMLNSLK